LNQLEQAVHQVREQRGGKGQCPPRPVKRGRIPPPRTQSYKTFTSETEE